MSLCRAQNDGATCQMPLGHSGDHIDGGYIWTQRDDEPGAIIAALKARLADRERRIGLARAMIRTISTGSFIQGSKVLYAYRVLDAKESLPLKPMRPLRRKR